VAPVDYDADGKFDEVLLVLSGSTYRDGAIPLRPAAYVFNFLVVDQDSRELWHYQCGEITRPFPIGGLTSPDCSQEEAASLHQQKFLRSGWLCCMNNHRVLITTITSN
jgi:hypothetical protein